MPRPGGRPSGQRFARARAGIGGPVLSERQMAPVASQAASGARRQAEGWRRCQKRDGGQRDGAERRSAVNFL